MGKFKRIQVNDIKAMQKTLDDLPDKNLGKTREEAAEMLKAQIMQPALLRAAPARGTPHPYASKAGYGCAEDGLSQCGAPAADTEPPDSQIATQSRL